MTEKELKYENLPYGFQVCFNSDCKLRETCMHVKNYFSSGNGPYYRYYHGENLLSPKQQEDIMRILADYGPTEDLAFDHYVTDFDFG